MKKLLTTFGLLLVAGCTDKEDAFHSSNQLLQQLRVALGPVRTMTHGYRILDLDSLTSFAWDSVYFFNGEEGERHISYTIGFPWTGPEVPNAYKRLLFVYQRRVVAFVDVNEAGPVDTAAKKWPLPIFMYPNPRPGKLPRAAYARSKSRFVAFRSCDNRSPFIPLVPIDNIATFQEEIERGCPIPPDL
jgi:hypothetical protein